MLIIKRNKSVEDFNPEKIKNAILKAMKFGIGNINEHIAQEISINIYNVRSWQSSRTANFFTQSSQQIHKTRFSLSARS